MADFYPSIEEARAWYASADLAHDFEHVLRVLKIAMKIAQAEGADQDIVHAAALLHDSRGAMPSVDGGDRMGHHLASAEFAGEVLSQAGWEQAAIEKVQHCIRAHRFRHDGEQPETIEAKCVFDADKLDVLGAIGAARTIIFGSHKGQSFYSEPSAKFLETGKTEEDEPYSAYHEYLYKLSKIKDRLYTETGKALAVERDAFLHQYFERLRAESRGEA